MQIFFMFERLDQKLPKGGQVPALKHFKIIIGYKTLKNILVQITLIHKMRTFFSSMNKFPIL